VDAIHGRDRPWIGEVLYFMRHRFGEGPQDRHTFAVVSWRLPDVEEEVQGSFQRYLSVSLEQVQGEGDAIPHRLVSVRYIQALVHMFHDCEGNASGQCEVDGSDIIHDAENPRWFLVT
jgi:hypothetical protein